MLLELWHTSCHDHFLGQPVPGPHHHLRKEHFSWCPVWTTLTYPPERRSSLYSTACLWEASGCDEVVPQSSLQQAKQAKGLQLLLTCPVLETLSHLGCLPLDTLWDNVLLILRHPKLHSTQCQAISAQRRQAQPPLLTSCWRCASCIPGHCTPFGLPGHTVGSY